MNHEESKLQQQCVAWFRAQYPHYAMLLVHPINEGSGHTQMDRRRQGIHKAEGAVAGVPDLLLFLPCPIELKAKGEKDSNESTITFWRHGLGIEFKTAKGRQSQEQREFMIFFMTARYEYRIIRTFEEFQEIINMWIESIPSHIIQDIKHAYTELQDYKAAKEREKFYKVIGKK